MRALPESIKVGIPTSARVRIRNQLLAQYFPELDRYGGRPWHRLNKTCPTLIDPGSYIDWSETMLKTIQAGNHNKSKTPL